MWGAPQCFEVPTDNIEERANFIVEKFVENLVPTIIDPESLFSKWDDWKNKFNSIKKGEVKESQVVLWGAPLKVDSKLRNKKK